MQNKKTIYLPDNMKYKPFEWSCTDEYLELCFDRAYSKLCFMYPKCKVDSCDYFGLFIYDDETDMETEYSIGRMGVGPLAMRNESTKEVFPLVDETVITSQTHCSYF